ncbi:MFS transporter, partial [Nostoc sp. NIES-2111]
NLVYGFVVLPETLPPERKRPFSLARANPAGALAAIGRHPVVLSFAPVLVLHFLATSAYPAVLAYYTIERYGWSEWEVGLSLATYGIVTAAVQGGLVGPLIRRFGEWRAAVIALTVEATVAFAYAAATQGWMIYVLLVAGALQNIAMPAINAMMSQRVGADEQGELQGAVAGLSGVTSIVGPLVATQLFGAFSGPSASVYLPGAPFIASGLMSLLALWLFVRRGRPKAAPVTAE